MQSADYVPGLSGWKIDPSSGDFEMADAGRHITGSAPSALYSGATPDNDGPFSVTVDGRVFINRAFVQQCIVKARIEEGASARAPVDEALAGRAGALEAAMASWKPSNPCLISAGRFAVTMARNSAGHYVAAGVGVGIDGGNSPECIDEILRRLATSISGSDLGLALQARVDAMESVRDVIRQELKPGGMLHRG